MSDLEDSDIEEQEPNDSDKEEDTILIPKQIPPKNIIPDSNIDSEDEDNDDIDDSDIDDEFVDEQQDLVDDNINDEPVIPNKLDVDEQLSPINSDIESEDEDYLQKLEPDLQHQYIIRNHPECITANSVEIENLTQITRNEKNIIIDENHKTYPFLTKYERTRILGQRTKQLNQGHPPYVSVPSDVLNGYLIAELELKAKKIPVIIRRPLPNGKSEYWKLQDLEQV